MNIWKQKYLEARRKVARLMRENATLKGELAMYHELYPMGRPPCGIIRCIEIDDYTFVETSFTIPETYEVFDDMANVVASVSLEFGALEAKYFNKGEYETIFTHKFTERPYKGSFYNEEERMQYLGEIADVLKSKKVELM